MRDLAALADCLRKAQRVAVLTGAGISAESGVPTFRDAQTGLWARYRAEDLATPEAFARDPKLVWAWYAWRRERVIDAQPNAGHLALAGLEQRIRQLTLITQNVDGLHQRAGSRKVVELHGSILRVVCSRACGEQSAYDPIAAPPPCPLCGAHLRPDVVWFGETLPVQALARASAAANDCELFFSIGTSALVYPAADLPFAAAAAGAKIVEINAATTSLTPHAHFVVQGPAGKVLPQLLDALTSA